LIENFRRVVNEVLFILGDTPASEFRRRGIARKEENNNRLIINISVVEGPYSEDISNSGRRGAGFFYWIHKIMPLYMSETYPVHSFAPH